MAGIVAKIDKEENQKIDLEALASRVQHRGSGKPEIVKMGPVQAYFFKGKAEQSHAEKLHVAGGGTSLVAVDGFINNLDVLAKRYLPEVSIQPINNNCARILHAGFQQDGMTILKNISGSFSGVYFDGTTLSGFKDPVGGKPMYYTNEDSYSLFASELKALSDLNQAVIPVDPGTIIHHDGNVIPYYEYPKLEDLTQNIRDVGEEWYAQELHRLIRDSVRDNILHGEHVSALLSGGIDSTIVVHCAKDLVDDLNVYTVAAEGSIDEKFARNYVKIHGLKHTIIRIGLEQMLEVLPDVIYALETFDAALIRSSVPMFIIAREVHNREKPDVLLTGEGGDELFGGYSYLKDFNNTAQFNQELLNLLEVEHKTGLQRVDRIPYYFSMEARAPLFDRRLVEFSFAVPGDLKIRDYQGKKVEKWLLRRAFEKELPVEFVWRKKQKFSSGANSQFLLKEYLEKSISDEEFTVEKHVCEGVDLRSKEELYYWRIFKEKFKPAEGTIQALGLTSNYEV